MKRLVFLFLLLCLPCLAVDRYAAYTDLGTGDGLSPANAMDLATAMLDANLAVGETIYLYDDGGAFGTFSFTPGTMREGTAWTTGNFVTLQAAVGETPTFTKIAFTTYTTTMAYIKIIGCTIDAGVVDTYPTSVNPVTFTAGGGQVIFQDCTIRGSRKSYSCIGGTAYDNLAYAVSIASSTSGPAHDIQFINCTFYAEMVCSTPCPNYNITFDGCTFRDTGKDTIVAWCHGLAITDCTFVEMDYYRYNMFIGGTTTITGGPFTNGEIITQAGSGATGRIAYTVIDPIPADDPSDDTPYFHQTSAKGTNFVVPTSDPIIGASSGATLTGGSSLQTAHPDCIDIIPIASVLSAITKGNPTKFTIPMNYYWTGDKVFITGIDGADKAEVNDKEWECTYVDGDEISIAYDSSAKDISKGGTDERITAVIRDLYIARNTFQSGNVGNSAVAINAYSSYWRFDDLDIESNLVIGTNLVYGFWFNGIYTGDAPYNHANFAVNNNTVVRSTNGIYIGYTGMIYGGCRVDNMYNNLMGGPLLLNAQGVWSIAITNHNNNTFTGETDPDGNWTSGSGDIMNADVDEDPGTYFTDYAGGVYTLKPNSPAARTGSALGGVTTDLNGNAISDPPDRGCYRFDKGKLIIIKN